MYKPKRTGSFMNLIDVNKWLVKNDLPELNTEGNQVTTKRIKNLMDEKTFKEMSCEVVTLLITDENSCVWNYIRNIN